MMNLPIKEIIKEYENNVKQSTLAKKYGVSPMVISRAIKKYYENLGQENPRSSNRVKEKINLPTEEIINKYEQGATLLSLSQEYNVTSSTILNRIKEYYKDKPMPRIVTSASIVAEYLKKGFPLEEILRIASTRRLIIPQSTIDKALREINKEISTDDNCEER